MALDALKELQFSISMYHKNGPDWTHKDGTEVFEVSVLIDRQEAIDAAIGALEADIARKTQSKDVLALYASINNLVSHIAFEGHITSDHGFVTETMSALAALDGGAYWPGWTEQAMSMADMLASTAPKDPAVNAELLDTLQILTLACLLDDQNGNLGPHVDGSILDAATAAIAKATGGAA